MCNASNGDDGCLMYGGAIAFQSEYRAEVLLCFGKPEGAKADIIYVLADGHDVVSRVGRASNDEIRAEDIACFGRQHVLPAEMHPMSFDLFGKFYMVVEDEGGTMVVADIQGGHCRCLDLFYWSILDAQLYQVGSSGAGGLDDIEIVRYDMQLRYVLGGAQLAMVK